MSLMCLGGRRWSPPPSKAEEPAGKTVFSVFAR
jgi:hypothetical protein